MAFDALKRLAQGLKGGAPAVAQGWRPPRLLDQGPLGSPRLHVDTRGRALALWRNGATLQAMRFWATGSDASPTVIQADPGKGERLGELATARFEDTVLAAWTLQADGRTQLVARTFQPGSEGESRTALTVPGLVQSLQVLVDRRGDGLMVWVSSRPEGYHVEALGFDARTQAWDPAPTRLDGPLAHPTPLALALGPKGEALAVWNHQGGGYEGLVSSHYFAKERLWSDRPVGVVNALARSLDLTQDAQGNVALLYLTGEGDRMALEACVMGAATAGWHGPTRLAIAQEIHQPRLGMADGGAAVALWRQSEVGGGVRLFARAFQNGKWAARPEALEAELGSGREHAFTLSPEGHGALAWAQASAHATGGAEAIHVRTFTKGQWGKVPLQLGQPTKFAHHSLCIAANGPHIATLWLAGVGHCGLMAAAGQ